MGRSIAIVGARGGVGKSTVAALLSVVLADCGKSVTLVDGDLTSPTQDMLFGVSHKAVFDLIDVIERGCSPQKALVRAGDNENLYLMPTFSFDRNMNITNQNMRAVVNELDRFSDFVIVDCPSGAEHPFLRAALSCGDAVLVMDETPQSVRGAKRVTGLLAEFGIRLLGFVMNCKEARDARLAARLVEEELDIRCLGHIRARKKSADITRLVEKLQRESIA